MPEHKKDTYKSKMTLALFIFIIGIIILLLGAAIFMYQSPPIEPINVHTNTLPEFMQPATAT